tara:strand:- start:911 stop:1246 length:336 start_codon:yes stop_codon:yes gene_type:complete
MKLSRKYWQVQKLEIKHNNKLHKTEYYITNDDFAPSPAGANCVAKVTKDDANLIAAAPELLDVLKEYVSYERTHDVEYYQDMKAAVKNNEYKMSGHVLYMAMDAINKAEGK